MSVPRYCAKPFPPYRFLPGVNPHPSESPQGHSYGKPEPVVAPLTITDWFKNEIYLYGVDLYNHRYWWESHEAWESLWKSHPKDKLTRDFLQGLIKVSAAFLKWELKTPGGVESHYQGAVKHFQKVAGEHPIYMGIDLPLHLKKLEQCFKAVHSLPVEQWPDPSRNYPTISLR